MKSGIKISVLSLSAALLVACGGGTGLGPGEIQKREDRLKERLQINWGDYNTRDYQDAITFFTQLLQQAETLEGIDAIRNQVKSEAHNGIGWSFFQGQQLDSAAVAFRQATRLNRRNADAWAGWSGVALAQGDYSNAEFYATQALDIEPRYSSASRFFDNNKASFDLGHDNFDWRHLHLLLAESYFQLGDYSASDRPDPRNAVFQMSQVNRNFRYTEPGRLLESLSQEALKLRETL